MRRSFSLLALLTLVFVGAACGEDRDTGFPPIPSGTATEVQCEQDTSTEPVEVGADPILIGDNWYTPLHASVKAGADIHWEQCGSAPHSVTFSTLDIDSSPGCQTDISKCTGSGSEFTTKIEKPGEYHYYCVIHGAKNSNSGMYGLVTVT